MACTHCTCFVQSLQLLQSLGHTVGVIPRRRLQSLPFAVPAVTGAVLYRLRDRDGRLLFIGATTIDLEERIRGQARTQPWWSDVASCTAETVTGDLRHAKWQAVIRERPRHNRRVSRPNLAPTRPAWVYTGATRRPLTSDERVFLNTGEVR